MPNQKTVLVVDDNEDILYTVVEGLKSLSPAYEIEVAKTPDECMTKIEAKTIPDLFILDIMLPEGNGIDLAMQLKENKVLKKKPIIFLTARTDEATKQKAKFYSKAFIEKPFDLKDLDKKIKKFL